jgi:hypothetical protein
METYRILVTESPYETYLDINDLAEKLKMKAPQIEWVTEVGSIMNIDDEIEELIMIKVPVSQYEAATYIFRLMKGYEDSDMNVTLYINELEDKLDRITEHCSFAPEEMEYQEYLTNISDILFELYLYGLRMPQGINLHLEREPKEPLDNFPDILFFPVEFLEEELVFQNNINFILSEVSTYLRPLRLKGNHLAPGFVYQLFRSFHSLDGAGKRILETIDLIHHVKSKMHLAPLSSAKKKVDVKKEATRWLKEAIYIGRLLQWGPLDNEFYLFPITDFADEPNIFLQTSLNGIAFGYQSIEWQGHVPAPIFVTMKVITWDLLTTLPQQEKESTILDALLKTIQSRKRQYKTCQFCGEKTPPEHRINSNTCHGCATEHFGVIY